MLEDCQDARERWGGVHELIDRWLQSRQNMLVKFCDLSATKAFIDNDPQQGGQLREFCQMLVDYVSAGHFEIYEQLFREAKEFNDGSIEFARQLYPQIDSTTDIALDFNDKYSEIDDLSALGDDLSLLGETLATRFEAEDQMIEKLHMAHKDLVA